MKKTNTFLNWQTGRWKIMFLFVFALGSLSVSTQAQTCSLACNGTTNISLDNLACEALVTPEMILNDQATSCPASTGYTVSITDQFGNPISTLTAPSPTNPANTGQYVDADYVGWTLHVVVTDNDSGNSCWGFITVEDKLAPVITCPTDTVDMYCYNLQDYFPVIMDNCDTAPDTILLSETVNANDCDGSMPDSVLKVITREYVAMDDYGNVSNTCEVHIRVNRLDSLEMPLIVCPSSLFLSNNTHLECDGNYPRITEGPYTGHPDPVFTGVPYIDPDATPGSGDEILLYPDPDLYCNILVSFTDVELAQIGCVTKIMRTWNIIEWSCSSPQRSRVCVQMIEIVDDEGPTFTCPADMTVTTNTSGNYNDPIHGMITCAANITLPALSLTDNCDNAPYTVSVTYPGGSLSTNGGPVNLPMGPNVITYTAYDGCYNSSTCQMTVTVVDNTAPVAVCDQFTVVSLTNSTPTGVGQTHVYASTFDDGSYDDCAVSCMVAQRMFDDPCECEVPSYSGMDYLGEYDGHHYYLSHLAFPGDVARKKAAALGGYLAVTRTGAEFNWVHQQVQDVFSTDAYYIGMERVGTGNTNANFRWINGQTLTYSNWGAGDPNNIGGIENCVEVWPNGEWNDVPCGETMRFVMELDDPCDGFSDYVPFCCGDVGNEDLMVTFRVIDIYGNYNDCMVNVEVQDKLAPVITCPASMNVECDMNYDENNLAASFGEATATDNCSVTITETADFNLNQCNIGTITRTFTATDAGGRTDVCTQIITFGNSDPFNNSPFNDITWPSDETIEGCADPESADFHPDNTGYPLFNEDECDLVGSNWDDQYFPFNNANGDACFKILRTWSVIDWCQPGLPQWTHLQVIKVNNTVDPVITSDCSEKTTCTFDAQCQDGFIELTASATDDCTEDMKWTAQIDIDNDGSFDGAYSQTGTGNAADVSGDYPIGEHSVLWTFEDLCGNKASCTQNFNIVNCKAPTPYCINGLAIDLMPQDTDGDGEIDWGMVVIWASDFDAGSNHPCGYPVTMAFSEDITDTNIEFNCNMMGNQSVDVYAIATLPDGSEVSAYCTTFVNVQDNMGACPTGGLVANVSGRIATENAEDIEDVAVTLDGGQMPAEMTDVSGEYAFPEMPYGGAYVVDPAKNTDPMNGVSTLDLVLIQKHILQLEALNSPYKLVAADINADQEISAIDLVELRKLILGIYADFPANESWRFIDAAFDITSVDPLSVTLPEVYEIESLNSDMIIDFVGVKTGDVNNSVTVNLTSTSSEARNVNALELNTEDIAFAKGDIIDVPFNVSDDMNLLGYQFTIDFDESVLELVSTNSAAATVEETNFGFNRINEGLVTTSWHDSKVLNVNSNEALFSIQFKAIGTSSISQSIEVNSSITNAEAYNDNVEVMHVNLRFGNDISGFALYQNTPNPFTNSTDISFTLPQAGNATLTFFDVTGKRLSTINNYYEAGFNTVSISKDQLSSAGVIYYTLETSNNSSTMKMVVLK